MGQGVRGVREEGIPVCVMHADTGGKGQEIMKERGCAVCVDGVCSGTG